MSTENKVPEIRFEGFSREWTLQKLKKVVSLENGFAFKSRNFQDEVSDLIVLTPGSVNIGGGFQEGKGHFYNEMGNFPTKYILKAGDIFVTMTDLTPTAQALGFPAIVPEDGRTYLHNQRLGKLTDFEGNKDFLFYLLSTSKNQKRIVLTSSGTTVKHSSPDKILNGESGYPEKSEQTKIGNYFQQLDTLITQHQQKHDKLLNIKKALLEKMFPKQGEDVPEIRFKGFSGEWDEKMLGDISEPLKGKLLSWNDINSDGKYECILYGHLYTNYGMVIDKINYSTNEDSKVVPRSCYGDILIPASDTTPTGIARATCIEKSDVLLGGDINILRPKGGIVGSFLSYNINKNRKQLIKLIKGTSVKHLVNSDLEKVELFIAKETLEQTKIGNLFKQLDTLINQHQTQLKKLKNIKQACLEKMFV